MRSSLRGWLDRRLLGVPVGDIAMTAVVLLYAVGSILTNSIDEGPRGLTLPVAVAFGLSLLGRSRLPLVAIVVVTMAGLVQALSSVPPGAIWSFAVFMVLAYSVAVRREESWAAVGLVVLVGGLWVEEWLDHGTDYLFILLVFGGAWLAGRGVQRLGSRVTRVEQHQRDLARLAVAEERVRIARELHDVLAGSLSVIAVQADAAEAVVGHDPAKAMAALSVIRDSARGSLAEMRQLLLVLRADDDEDTDRRPARGLADLPALVTAMRESGLPLDAELPPADLDMGAGAGLAAYRIAQEGLTNVVRHAGRPPSALVVRSVAGGLLVEVTNAAGEPPGRRLPGGHGLLGVDERVHALGGRVEHGPVPGGGYRLSAWLPPARNPTGAPA
ncbi:MAG: histidine kinase [Nostocoides sp.]